MCQVSANIVTLGSIRGVKLLLNHVLLWTLYRLWTVLRNFTSIVKFLLDLEWKLLYSVSPKFQLAEFPRTNHNLYPVSQLLLWETQVISKYYSHMLIKILWPPEMKIWEFHSSKVTRTKISINTRDRGSERPIRCFYLILRLQSLNNVVKKGVSWMLRKQTYLVEGF